MGIPRADEGSILGPGASERREHDSTHLISVQAYREREVWMGLQWLQVMHTLKDMVSTTLGDDGDGLLHTALYVERHTH